MSTIPFVEASTRILGGTAQFRRTNLALFLAGFSTFALLYGVQPLMPVFAEEFHVSPATSSLTISLTTGAVAIMMLFAGALADAIGRKRIMGASMLLSSLLAIAATDPVPAARISRGPRVGISRAADRPWRYWITGDPSVSPYRAYAPRRATQKPVTGRATGDGTIPQ